MSDTELKLMLLRFNMLSKERAEAVYKWRLSGKSAHCRDERLKDEWLKYADEMTEMMKDLSKYSRAFAYAGSKTEGEVEYAVYKITVTATPGWVGIA